MAAQCRSRDRIGRCGAIGREPVARQRTAARRRTRSATATRHVEPPLVLLAGRVRAARGATASRQQPPPVSRSCAGLLPGCVCFASIWKGPRIASSPVFIVNSSTSCRRLEALPFRPEDLAVLIASRWLVVGRARSRHYRLAANPRRDRVPGSPTRGRKSGALRPARAPMPVLMRVVAESTYPLC